MSRKPASTKDLQELYQAIANIESPSEAKKILRDLCTVTELTSMAERLQVAKLVDEKETYRSINKKTGVSTATITRVAHWLHHGMGGYKLLIERMKR